MNFMQVWQFLMMLLSAATQMETLAANASLHTGDAGIPPVYVTWRDGRRFEIDLRIKRAA